MGNTIYAGPGKLYTGGTVLWPQAENGTLHYMITQEKNDVASAMHGRVASTLGNTIGKIALTPFDNWSALPFLFPAFTGVTTSAGAGALVIGTRPHGAVGADVPATIWSPDGRSLVVARTAITKHPELHLGVDKPLFGSIELTALPKSSAAGLSSITAIGTAAVFHAIHEGAQADPGGQMILTDFIREAWLGVFGATAGFGGDAGLAVQAEDEWTITPEIKYSELKVQKQTVAMKLDSAQFMAKCRPVGPTWTNIEADVLTGRVTGLRWANPGNLGAAVDLALTSTSGKTITLKNCDVMGEGFEFGGTKLGTGEVGWVNEMAFTAGAPNPLIIFSA